MAEDTASVTVVEVEQRGDSSRSYSERTLWYLPGKTYEETIQALQAAGFQLIDKPVQQVRDPGAEAEIFRANARLKK